MKFISALAVLGLLGGCGTPFHVNPIAKPYGEDETSVRYDLKFTREPFHLGKDCLPGLGGQLTSTGELACKVSAVQAIALIGAGEATPDKDILPFNPAVDSSPALQSRIARNRLQDHLIFQSNDVCDIHKSALYGKISSTNALFDFAALGLTAASAIVTGTDITRLLSATAAATVGAQSSVNENFIENQLVSAIIRAIDKSRERTRSNLVTKRSKSLDEYTVEAALGDVLIYHEQCSIYAALAELNAGAEKIAPTLDQRLERIKKLREFAGETKDAALMKSVEEAEAAILSEAVAQGND